MSAAESAGDARRVLRTVESGVLATMSQTLPGYPFGSVTPFVLLHDGRVAIYVSDIAEHSKNLVADARVSLTVLEERVADAPQGADRQALGRVTVVGDASVVADADDEQVIAQRYFALFPRARAYASTHGFRFVCITPVRVRWIGGFGRIHWIEPGDWPPHAPAWSADETGIVEHMNDDHRDAMVRMLAHHCAFSCDDAEMLALDVEGFHLRAAGRTFWLPFPDTCTTSQQVRSAMVHLAAYRTR